MAPSWLHFVFATTAILWQSQSALAQPGVRQPASPGYSSRDACPEKCSITGPDPSNWSLYHNLEQFQSCKRTLFYHFSLYDDVDDPNTFHRIYACTSYGADWSNFRNKTKPALPAVAERNATYQIGWERDGTLAASQVRAITEQIRDYLENGHAPTNTTTILFSTSASGAVGLYIGKGLQNEGMSSFALKTLRDYTLDLNTTTNSLAMQLCEKGSDADHIFGFMASSNATFTAIQDALKTWSKAQCLTFNGMKNLTGPAVLTTRSVLSANGTNSTGSSLKPATNSDLSQHSSLRLRPRAECATRQVVAGDSCSSLATKCGISPADFTEYNPSSTLCSSLQPLQHVCCSSGTLPDFAPKPNSDGSCATYTVVPDDTCSTIGAANSLTVAQITAFNKDTWAFNGCTNLWAGTIICLSTGSPPMPASVVNAVCGPQVPGTSIPPSGTNISTLNPCPLNACCDVWGQCGITDEFCTDTGLGPPGTAEPGTNGCISNCGTEIIKSGGPATFRKVGYFEGYGMGRECLYQDASQIDPTQYTHLHFAFGTLTADYQVETGDLLSSYEFSVFKRLSGPLKIMSFGGWAFSTEPSTYFIFREGAKAANRVTMATNIANFVKDNNLDGVDIDWEYPGAPDIPGIPPGSKDDGANYLALLVLLKNLLPGKSVSIAAPASYWYLKAFPIASMSKIVDYIVFMTYDLHGQWDAGNQNSQPGCLSGQCLRSNVNLTETLTALSMITKAGVPSDKVVVGVTSYGRSFQMAQAGCHTADCLYTGSQSQSNAAPGPCTDTAGYIADAEIYDIINGNSNSKRSVNTVNYHGLDTSSNTNILVYNDNQWVGYMSPEVKATRKGLYAQLSMGGTTDWATDLEQYNDPPSRSDSWEAFRKTIMEGGDPSSVGPRTGNWTSVTCGDSSVSDIRGLTASQRWSGMDGNDAWEDVINVWKTIDKGHRQFTQSVFDTLHGPESADCGSLAATSNCITTLQCATFEGQGIGAAAYEIYNSFTIIHQMYQSFYTALKDATGTIITPALQDFENKFAPVEEPDDEWLELLIDFIPLGFVSVGAPIFHSFLKSLPYFVANPNTFNILKDTTFSLVTSSNAAFKDVATGNVGNWTAESQASFSNYLAQELFAWGNATEMSLKWLFSGEDDAIDSLGNLILDGKMIEGKGSSYPPSTDTSSEQEAKIATAYYTYAIPAAWQAAGRYPFVLDSGYDCGTEDPLGKYMLPDTQHASAGCYNGKLYYLASVAGESELCINEGCADSYFPKLPGLDDLDGDAWGGVTKDDIIAGAVKTYEQNGNKNNGAIADSSNDGTFTDLIDADYTTPGFVRLPVCSADEAFQAWDFNGGATSSLIDQPGYPCVIRPGPNFCGESTFVDQTSDASPLVSDCQMIIKNIEGTDGSWETQVIGKNQREIAKFGGCSFGVEATKVDGNVNFEFGAQDVIDVINDAIRMFGGGGKVGAKGTTTCDGNIKKQSVEWGIY